jgi:uncharacterized protein
MRGHLGLRPAHALLGLAVGAAYAAGVTLAADVPALQAHVNDYAHVLPAQRAAALEARLADYEQRTGHQLALLSVPSLAGDSIEDYSMRVAERWKLGHKGKDDGLVLLIVPSERAMRIEVGYGLEGVIPDAVAARVVREVLTPAFRQGDFAGGIDAAFAALMQAAGGGGAGTAAAPPQPRSLWGLLGPMLFPFLLFLVVGWMSRGSGLGGLLALGMMGSRGWGAGGSRGGGGGFGGGGGGFGGGGGGFGGGGASGRW